MFFWQEQIITLNAIRIKKGNFIGDFSRKEREVEEMLHEKFTIIITVVKYSINVGTSISLKLGIVLSWVFVLTGEESVVS